MGNFFNSRIFDGISKLADVMLLSFYFLVCSIPVFTMGASGTALYYATHKCVYKGRGYTTEFFHSFKANFKQSTLSWLIFMVLFALLSGDIYIIKNLLPADSPLAAAPIFFMVLFMFAFAWAIYHFAYIARFENGFKASFKISGVFMVANIGWTAVIIVELIAVFLLVYRFIFLLIFAPGIVACIIHPVLEHVFKKYMSPEDLTQENEF